MQCRKAIALFSRVPQINRSNRDEPYASLTWEDLDTLFTAMLGDVVERVCSADVADVFLYRDEKELSDDIFTRVRAKIEMCDLPKGAYAEQIQQVIENIFAQHYDRIVVVLDNNPLTSQDLFKNVFHQLEYEDDCLVYGPTLEGKCYLMGMKSNHSLLFTMEEGDPMGTPDLLMGRLCKSNAFLFPTRLTYSLDSGFNLARLKLDIEKSAGVDAVFPHRTHDLFKMLDKKYKTKKIPQ